MPDPRSNKPTQSSIDSGAQANLVVGIVFLAFMGQMILNPIIAPLSRQIGLREWHIGATISLAAIVLASLSAYWGRASQRFGAKRVFQMTHDIIHVSSTLLPRQTQRQLGQKIANEKTPTVIWFERSGQRTGKLAPMAFGLRAKNKQLIWRQFSMIEQAAIDRIKKAFSNFKARIFR